MDDSFALPGEIAALVTARNRLRSRFQSFGLDFALDGNLIGDLGEALAAEEFGLKLTPRGQTGIDGTTSDGRTVQVKATGTGRGPAFRMVDVSADHLLFFSFDLEILKCRVVYNGPEAPIRKLLPSNWQGQKAVTIGRMSIAGRTVLESDRLPRLKIQRS